jgi:hypothetical protein
LVIRCAGVQVLVTVLVMVVSVMTFGPFGPGRIVCSIRLLPMPRTTASGLDTTARIFSALERELIHERTTDDLTAAAGSRRCTWPRNLAPAVGWPGKDAHLGVYWAQGIFER